MTIYPNLIIDALRTVRYPGTGKDIVDMGMLNDDIRIDGNRVSFSLTFEKPTDPFIKSVVKAAEAAILAHVGADVDIKGNIGVKTAQDNPVRKIDKPLPGVKNIIAVSSGKGGVGKSTIACNLAVALAMQGYRVGMLDADIFGPSMPKMFGAEDEQLYMHEVDGKNMIIPLEKYGVKMLSIGFLVDKEKAVLWRGAMASNAMRQLITEADWGELDYFIIDMPPGTSDIHLTLVQTLAITGAIVPSRVPSWSPHRNRWHLPTLARASACSWASMWACLCWASSRTCRGSRRPLTPMRNTSSSGVTVARNSPRNWVLSCLDRFLWWPASARAVTTVSRWCA